MYFFFKEDFILGWTERGKVDEEKVGVKPLTEFRGFETRFHSQCIFPLKLFICLFERVTQREEREVNL